MKTILTIAGSDSGGGAGIQADLKTISLLGGFGMSAITAITAQNTLGIQGVYPVPVEFVEKQIDSVVTDIGADAVKTGMLVNSEILIAVSKKIREHRIKNLVVDPVMLAKSGDSLLSREAREVLVSELLPLSFLVTPNLAEASILGGREVKDMEGMKRVAREIQKKGAKNVLIKGGHLSGEPTDLLYHDGRFIEYPAVRIDTKNTHGTGCTYSAAIATGIARGESLPEAIRRAKEFITIAIKYSLDLGSGHGPTNHYAPIQREMDRYQIIQDLKEGISRIKTEGMGDLIPEVQSNLGFALPYSENPEDVAAVPGRINKVKESVFTNYDPEFGASQHIARIILTVLKYDRRYRSAMNIKFSREIINQCEKLGFSVKSFDRKKEPKAIKEKEGTTLEWGVNEVLTEEKTIPDIIYDQGDLGKEPMVRIIGINPVDVVNKVIKIFQCKGR